MVLGGVLFLPRRLYFSARYSSSLLHISAYILPPLSPGPDGFKLIDLLCRQQFSFYYKDILLIHKKVLES